MIVGRRRVAEGARKGQAVLLRDNGFLLGTGCLPAEHLEP